MAAPCLPVTIPAASDLTNTMTSACASCQSTCMAVLGFDASTPSHAGASICAKEVAKCSHTARQVSTIAHGQSAEQPCTALAVCACLVKGICSGNLSAAETAPVKFSEGACNSQSQLHGDPVNHFFSSSTPEGRHTIVQVSRTRVE